MKRIGCIQKIITNSNTTLVKVKSDRVNQAIQKTTEFKYNTC